MRKIVKGREPDAFKRWRRQNPEKQYQDLTHNERQPVREACAKEQRHLCAYCCSRIDINNTHTVRIDHVKPQSRFPRDSLNYQNMVVSCSTPNQCDIAKDNHIIDLTPFMQECESELNFTLSGRVRGHTDRSERLIETVNLGSNEDDNEALINKRRCAIDAVLWKNGIDPEEGIEDDDLIDLLVDELRSDTDDKMEPFAPVLVNILHQWRR